MKKKLFILIIFFPFIAINSLFAIEMGQLVIVTKDSIPLRTEPNNQAKIAKYADASLQLKVVYTSEDKKWYQVQLGEQKCYQFEFNEEYWVFHEDVYQEPKNSYSEIKLDVSVLENKNLQNAKRITYKDYLYKLKSLTLNSAYYVGSTYLDESPTISCSSPFSICAQIYEPGRYFQNAWLEERLKHTDASDFEELKNRYKQLYENGTTTPFYEIKSDSKIETISEKLICAKIIMAHPGCYAEGYIGTELDVLSNKIYTVNSNRFLSSFPINSENLFQTKLKGGVQYVNFLYILKVKYTNKQEETIVRRIFLGWPKCL